MINEIKNYCNRINARLAKRASQLIKKLFQPLPQFCAGFQLASLKPTAPRIINNIDAIFNRLTDSCKNTIPIILINNIPKEHQIA